MGIDEWLLVLVTELNTIKVPCILILRKDEFDFIVEAENLEFKSLLNFGITKDRLLRNSDFQDFCINLLNHKHKSTDREIIYLGSEGIKIDIYGESRRSKWYDDENINKSDVAFIQIYSQEYQDYIDKVTLNKNTQVIEYQKQTIEKLNKEIKKLFKEVSEISELVTINSQSHQNINKILTDNKVLLIPKDFNVAKFIKVVSSVGIIISSLNLAQEPVYEAIKSSMETLLELAGDEDERD